MIAPNKVRMLSILFVLFVTCAFTVGSANVAHGEKTEVLLIIANKSFPAESLTLPQVKRIFLKQQTRVDSMLVIPVNARPGSKARKAFLQKVLQQTPGSELSYWQDKKMKTATQPPVELENTVRAVFSMKGSISYCFESEFNPSVAKILLRL